MIDESTIQGYSYETAFWMAGVFNADYPLEQLGELTQEVCAKLRAIACFHLLKDGGVNSFYHNLIRSGRARAAYLKRCMDEVALEDHFRASGRYAAVCDCVAANDSDLAVRIIELFSGRVHAGPRVRGRLLLRSASAWIGYGPGRARFGSACST